MKRIRVVLFVLFSFSIQTHARLSFVITDGEIKTNFSSRNVVGERVIIEEEAIVIGTGSNAFRVRGPSIAIFNRGKILTNGNGFNGIFPDVGLDTFNAVITNSGLISTAGIDSDGIVTDDGWVVINSGLISTAGTGSDAIFMDPDIRQNLIINSGTIKSVQAFALNLEGNDTTLTLLRGSNLQGFVQALDNLFLNVETGLNLALTLAAGSFGGLGIEAPFALVGDTIACIDPTGFALQADVLADLSDTILDGIYRFKTGLACPCLPYSHGELWVQGIGSSRERSRNKKRVGYDNWQGGGLIGYSASLLGGQVGVFGGVTYGEAEVDQKTQKAEMKSYVGGFTYEWLCCNTFLGFALAAGYIDWDNERFVMYNLANEGVEKAKVDIDGRLITSELTIAHNFFSLWSHPTMSFTFRYAGLHLGNYNEKGSIANLSVKKRDIDLLTTRFEVALPYTASRGVCCWSVEPYVGLFGRFQVNGNRVKAELLGESLCFSSRNPRNLAAFLLGFRGIQSFDHFNLFISLEGSFDSCSSSRLVGEGGISFSY